MSSIILQVAQNLRAIQELMPLIVKEIVEENASLIEDMNIAQLQEGKRADGETLPDYSPVSVMKFGKPPGPIKLYDKGDFYRGMKVRTFGDVFELDNTDNKVGKLTFIYGEAIIGLSVDHIEELKFFIILPEAQKKTRNLLLNE